GTVCVVGKMRDLILQLSKSSIYSTKPVFSKITGTTTMLCHISPHVYRLCQYDTKIFRITRRSIFKSSG
ncbi:hypothetical protein RAF57_21695, partial [Klebsiella pneumoniae]